MTVGLRAIDLRRRALPVGIAVVIAIGVAIRIVLIATPFTYIPDVLYYDTQAVKALLVGSNPYGHTYVVPSALATVGARNVFAYLPGVVEFLTPFGAVTDVRVGLVVCDVLVATALFSLRGKRSRPVAAVYMLLPTSILFTSWYPNDTLVGMAFLGLSIAKNERGHRWVSSALLGAALASSQLVWLIYPFILFPNLKAGKSREAALAILVALALVAPFVILNPAVFLGNTVSFEFSRPVQGLLTPQPFGANVNPTLSGVAMTLLRTTVPLTVKGGIAFAAMLLFLRRSPTTLKALLNGSFFVIVGIFVLPSDFSWWYLELPLMTLMAWIILVGKPSTGLVPGREPLKHGGVARDHD